MAFLLLHVINQQLSNRGIISFLVAPIINAVDVCDCISLSGAPHAYFGAP